MGAEKSSGRFFRLFRGAGLFDAGAGVPGVETLLPAFFTAAAQRGYDAPRLTAHLLSSEPARFFGIEDRKGAIVPGRDADLAVLEPGRFPWDETKAHDELRWSPYHGLDFEVRVSATYLRGALAWNGERVLNEPGNGTYVDRRTVGWFA